MYCRGCSGLLKIPDESPTPSGTPPALLRLPAAIQRAAQIIPHLGIVGFNLQRAAICGDRLVQSPADPQRAAQIVACLGIIRALTQRLAIVGDRLFEPASAEKCDAEIIVRAWHARLECNCLLIGGDRLVKPVQHGERFAEIEMRLGKVAFQRQCRYERTNGRLRLALSFEQDAIVVVRCRQVLRDRSIPRPQQGCLLEDGDGLGIIADAEQCQAQVH